VNEGEDALLVHGITGTLHDPNGMSQVKMNFTGVSINETVAAESEISYSYRFLMPANTPVETFHMMFHIFYTGSNSKEQGVIAFFNSTVEMYESEEMDWHAFSATAEKVGLFTAVVGTAVALVLYSQDFGSTVGGSVSAPVSAGGRMRNSKKGGKKGGKKHN
jgi:hypothetical protein